MVIGIGGVAIDAFWKFSTVCGSFWRDCAAARLLNTSLSGTDSETTRKATFGARIVAGSIAADSEEKLRLEIMGIGAVDALEPCQRRAIFLLLRMQPPELEAGLRKSGVQAGRLREEVVFLFGEAANSPRT